MHTVTVILALALGALREGRLKEPPPTVVNPAPNVPQLPEGVAAQVHEIEVRREARDMVERSVGPEARALTREYSDLGIYSLQRCSPATGRRLVAWYSAGGLNRLKDPRAALAVIQLHGDPVADWMISHGEELADPESLEAFCRSPFEYVHDLRSLSQAAEALRNSRKFTPSSLTTTPEGKQYLSWAFLGAAVLAVGWVGYSRLRSRPGF